MLAGAAVVASLLPPIPTTVVTVKLLAFVAWAPVALWLIVRTARTGLGPSPQPMRLPGVAAGVLVMLVVGNGLTPYLAVKVNAQTRVPASAIDMSPTNDHAMNRTARVM